MIPRCETPGVAPQLAKSQSASPADLGCAFEPKSLVLLAKLPTERFGGIWQHFGGIGQEFIDLNLITTKLVCLDVWFGRIDNRYVGLVVTLICLDEPLMNRGNTAMPWTMLNLKYLTGQLQTEVLQLKFLNRSSDMKRAVSESDYQLQFIICNKQKAFRG